MFLVPEMLKFKNNIAVIFLSCSEIALLQSQFLSHCNRRQSAEPCSTASFFL